MPQFGKSGTKHNERSIPSLDGLRALSIALVLLAHARRTRGFPAWLSSPALTDHGALGVQIFFVISGFLITSLLLTEKARTGTISLSLFYARRTLRIFPPFYVFLGVLAVCKYWGGFHLQWSNLLAAAVYTMNYVSNGVWITGHIWSLSVEEQFYLVWPLALKLAGRKRALRLAATLAVASPLFCLALYLMNGDAATRASKFFPLIADSIAWGCMLAGGLGWLRQRARLFRQFGARWGDLVLLALPALDLGRSHPRVHFAVTETALNACVCFLVIRYTQFPAGFAARILNHPCVAFAGRLSYSLYLWQQLFTDRFGATILQSFPLNIACALACALLSYYAIEKPMAAMRGRLRPRIGKQPVVEIAA
jgi:peptidoglycan/LPS O-acetylase OafA/YrhL